MAAQIWHLFGQMAQKSCSVKRKHSALCPPGPVQGLGTSVRIRSLAGAKVPAAIRGLVDCWGKRMSNRSWFFASSGQQQGPYPEAQFRDLIARGTITPQTLVWCEGMAGWEKAGEVPGLMSGAAGAPPVLPQGGGAAMGASGYGGGYAGGGILSLEMGIWDFTWRSIV